MKFKHPVILSVSKGSFSQKQQIRKILRLSANQNDILLKDLNEARYTEIIFQRLYKIKFVLLGKQSGAQSPRSLNKAILSI